MLCSIGVICGAVAIRFTVLTWIDPVVAVGIGLWVLPRTLILLRDTANVLLEGVPRGLSLNAISQAIAGDPGVPRAHDLHVWSITSDYISCSSSEDRRGGNEVGLTLSIRWSPFYLTKT